MNFDRDDLSPYTRALYDNLVKEQRAALAKSITLVESNRKDAQEEARKFMTLVTRHCKTRKPSFRIGLSGPPGAGKSTFIEAFGTLLTERGHKVAVLAVDPSSATTGGSLLGDKTRMTELTRNPNAFIRPSPNRGHLGGVTRTTNEAIVLCEAAGYDVVLVETVGVGQSEHMVSDMVDALCLILPPASGDELQGIKRGIVEMADLVLVNKSDGDFMIPARRTKTEYISALKFMRPKNHHWKTRVMCVSAKTGDGLEEALKKLQEFHTTMTENGEIRQRRVDQQKLWMWSYIYSHLSQMFITHPVVNAKKGHLENLVTQDLLSPGAASDILIDAFLHSEDEKVREGQQT